MNKKKMLFLLPLIGAMSLAGCKKKEEAACSHADENSDFVCDLCGATLATTGVELDTSNAKKLFSLGESFSSAGVKVIATSELGGTKELAFTTSQPDMSSVGDKTVVVTYGEGENDKKSYTINVSYWSEADLDVLGEETLGGYYGEFALPYLPGYGMKVEAEYDDEELESWKIVAYGASESVLAEVYQMYLDFEKVVKIKGSDVTFKFYEVAAGVETYHGLSKVQVLRMSASYVFQGVANLREYPIDEYYIMGLNAQNQLVIETRVINALLEDSYARVEEICNGEDGFKTSAGYHTDIPKPIGNYLNEIAEDEFVLPETLPTDADSGFFPENLQSTHPLDESLDKYDSAWDIVWTKASASDKDAYVGLLVAAGYEAVEEEGVTVYTKSSEFIGKMEFIPYFDAEHNWFGFQFYYTMPEKYDFVSRMHPGIVSLLEDGLDVHRYDLDSSYYSSSNEEIDAWFKVNQPAAVEPTGTEGEEGYIPGKSSEQVAIEELIDALKAAGFSVTSAAKASKYYGEADCWTAKLTDYANFEITVYVFQPEKGECEVSLEIKKYYVFTPQDVVDVIFGEVTPTLSEGVYSATVEGTISQTTTLQLAIKALDISNIDYFIFEDGEGGWFFSGVTKDKGLIYTVELKPASVAGEITISLEVEALSKHESFFRSVVMFCAHYFNVGYVEEGEEDAVVAAIRYVNYGYTNAGDPAFQFYTPTGTGDLVLNNYFIPGVLVGFTLASTSGTTRVYTNGEVDFKIDIVDDGEHTAITIICSAAAPQA